MPPRNEPSQRPRNRRSPDFYLSTRGNEWVAALLHERIAQLPSLRRRLE
jgi:hypothetical protein